MSNVPERNDKKKSSRRGKKRLKIKRPPRFNASAGLDDRPSAAKSRPKLKIARPSKVKRESLVFPKARDRIRDDDYGIDADEVRRGITTLFEPEQVIEVRALNVLLKEDNPNSNFRHKTVSGFFEVGKPRKLIRELNRIVEAKAIYVTAHQVKPALLARCNSQLAPSKDASICASKSDIASIRWIFFDIDPKKEDRHIAASPDERQAAHQLLTNLANSLYLEYGLPPGVAIDSGNGAYLLLPCDLPPERASFVEAMLKWAAETFAHEGASIDSVTHDLSRIMRMPGTINAKGDHCPKQERVHRYAHVMMDFREQTRPGDLAITQANLPAIAERCGFTWPPPDESGAVKPTGNRRRKKGEASLVEQCRRYIEQMPAAVEGQGGSKSAFSVACQIYRFGLSDEQALDLFREYNKRCVPSWSEAEMSHKLTDARKTVEEKGELGTMGASAQPSQANQLMAMVDDLGGLLFHDTAGECYARFPVADHEEVSSIRSKHFSRFLTDLYGRTTSTILRRDGLCTAVDAMEAKAHFSSSEHPVHLRLAACNGKVYLDLADAGWRVVEVDANDWRVLDKSPVMFRREAGMLPLPVPVRGGQVQELQRFHGPHSDKHTDDFVMSVAWLLGALCPGFPFPILVLHGEQGTGKSTWARMLRRLVDPSKSELRAQPKDERDLAVSAHNNYVIALDNLSSLPEWLSDSLCRLSTGGGFQFMASHVEELQVKKRKKPAAPRRGIAGMSKSRREIRSRGAILPRWKIQSNGKWVATRYSPEPTGQLL